MMRTRPPQTFVALTVVLALGASAILYVLMRNGNGGVKRGPYVSANLALLAPVPAYPGARHLST